MIRYNINILRILILSVFILLLNSCSYTDHQSDNYCTINKNDNLDCFNTFNKSLSVLKIPYDLHVKMSIPFCSDYDIPKFDSKTSVNIQKMNKKPNIFPPSIVFQDNAK